MIRRLSETEVKSGNRVGIDWAYHNYGSFMIMQIGPLRVSKKIGDFINHYAGIDLFHDRWDQ